MAQEEVLHEVRVIHYATLSPHISQYLITKPDGFSYKSGQYIKIFLQDEKQHFYSIANCNSHNYIELHVKGNDPNSSGAKFISKITLGSIFFISNAMGTCVCPNRITSPIVLVAGGCGFAPIKAIIEHIEKMQPIEHSVFLYWGGQNNHDLYFHDQMKQLQKNNHWFYYTPILNNLSKYDEVEYKKGNIGDIVFDNFKDLKKVLMFVNGPAPMVQDVYHKALKYNLNKKNFYTDCKM